MKVDKLTAFQEAFAQAYVRCGNGSDAYRAAGYSIKNKTAKSVNECASRVLAHVNVVARVAELQAIAKKIADKKFEIDSNDIIRHLEILRKARIDEYVQYTQIDIPVTRISTTGRGKDKVTTHDTYMRTEVKLIFKPWNDLTDEQKMAIDYVKQDRFGNIELKLHGKQWTIDMINKHLGLYEKDNRQKTPDAIIPIDMTKMSVEILKAIQDAYIQPET